MATFNHKKFIDNVNATKIDINKYIIFGNIYKYVQSKNIFIIIK